MSQLPQPGCEVGSIDRGRLAVSGIAVAPPRHVMETNMKSGATVLNPCCVRVQSDAIYVAVRWDNQCEPAWEWVRLSLLVLPDTLFSEPT